MKLTCVCGNESNPTEIGRDSLKTDTVDKEFPVNEMIGFDFSFNKFTFLVGIVCKSCGEELYVGNIIEEEFY